jgi:AAA domain
LKTTGGITPSLPPLSSAGKSAWRTLCRLKSRSGRGGRGGYGRTNSSAWPFIWNATNISRQLREHCISLCAAYNARVRIIYVEAGAAALAERNRSRKLGVPPEVINRLLARWEPPDLTEAHQVEVIVR